MTDQPGASVVSREQAMSDRLLVIAGLVNQYHNDGTTLTAAETLAAVAEALGDPFKPDESPLKAHLADLHAENARLTAERDEWKRVIVPEGGAMSPDCCKRLFTAAVDKMLADTAALTALQASQAVTEAGRDKACEALDFAQGAILDAIGLEDGLDGKAGAAVIAIIREALAANGKPLLPLPNEHTEDNYASVVTALEAMFGKKLEAQAVTEAEIARLKAENAKLPAYDWVDSLRGNLALARDRANVAEASLTSKDAEITRLTGLVDRLREEARFHAQEARTQRATVHECYQVIGAQTGDWNGAEPVRAYVEAQAVLWRQLEELMGEWRKKTAGYSQWDDAAGELKALLTLHQLRGSSGEK